MASWTWNQEVIRTLFGEKQWQNIASIPLVSSRLQDTLVWRSDNSGVYTSKSGYRWLITEGGTKLNNENTTTFFTKLWELKIPSKICILIWRIVNGYIPTLQNLKARSLVRNTVCPVCQVEEESVEHLFRDCIFTQQVLRGLGVTVTTCNQETSWKNWLVKDFENQSIRDCKLRAITYWAIWHNRNKSYHEGVRETATEVVGFIKAYDIEISATREKLASSCDGRISTWEPPMEKYCRSNYG